jgi:hypothetical protein
MWPLLLLLFATTVKQKRAYKKYRKQENKLQISTHFSLLYTRVGASERANKREL